MRIKKEEFLENISVFFLVLSFIMLVLYPIIRVPVIANALLFLASLFSLVLNNRIYKLNNIKVLFLMMILVQVTNIRTISYIQANRYNIIALIVIFIYIFLSSNSKINFKLYYIIFIPIFISILVILTYKFNYYYIVEKVLPFDVKEYNNHLISEGYMPVVFTEIGYISELFVIGIIILISKFLNEKKNIYLYYSLILVMFLYLLGRRLDFIVSILVSMIMIYIYKSVKRKGELLLIGLCIVIFIFTILIYNYNHIISYSGNNRMLEMLKGLFEKQDISNGRIALYDRALLLFRENFIVGIGWGNFSKYSKDIIAFVQNVHSIYLQLLTETGMLGFSLYIGAYLSIFFYTLKKFEKNKNIYVLFSLGIQVYILLKGSFDNPIYYPNFWIIYYLALRPIFRLNDVKGNKDENK